MARGGELATLAEAIGRECQVGPPPPELRGLARMLAMQGATEEITRALFAETRAKRPKSNRIDGYIYLLGEAMDELRLSRNGGDVDAGREVAGILALIGVEAAKASTSPAMLMMIARTLKQAGLDPPVQLQDAMGKSLAMHDGGPAAHPKRSDLHAQLESIAADFGNDAFALHTELAAMAAAFPLEAQAALIVGLFESKNAVVRAAALGFVLSPEPKLAQAALAGCAQAADRAALDDGASSRLVMMRPWLQSEQVRSEADAVIARLRRRAAAKGPATPASKAGAIVELCYATVCDGAGAQSVVAVCKLGRQWGLVSVLIKDEEGVCDAWVGRGLSKRELNALVAQMVLEANAGLTSFAFVRQRLGDALGRNLAASPPPYGLVEVLELLGLGVIAPARIDPGAVIDALLSGAPDTSVSPTAVALAHQRSRTWVQGGTMMETWFEAGPEVEALLSPIRGRAKREAAVLKTLLPRRRDFWMGQLAWTAATLKDHAGDDPLWLDMALVGRDLGTATAVADVALMQSIAKETVRAFERRP